MAAHAVLLRAGVTLAGAGAYIVYQDAMRYPRMRRRFASGRLIGPAVENQYEVAYFRRQGSDGGGGGGGGGEDGGEDGSSGGGGMGGAEEGAMRMLSNAFTNEYYLVRGEVGSGKSRLLVETVRELVRTRGATLGGAPVYMLASQGTGFAETLAEAVDFRFDEHLNFRFALARALGAHAEEEEEEEKQKLRRVLDAVEQAAFGYARRYRRPLVLVVDDVGALLRRGDSGSGALCELQVKAKLWADTNVAKVVFVTNDEGVEAQLQQDQGCWSRCHVTLHVGDLWDAEAQDFLQRHRFYEQAARNEVRAERMSREHSAQVVEAVGGRVHHLVKCRRDWDEGISAADSIARLTSKSCEKLLAVERSAKLLAVMANLTPENNYTVCMVDMVRRCPLEDIQELVKLDVLALVRDEKGILVKFESRTMRRAYVDLQTSGNLEATH